MILPVLNLLGEEVDRIEAQDDVFAVPPHPAVVHQALVRQQANARQGNAVAKTRGQVAGSTRKPFSQKHTGRARRGSLRTPLQPGGGKAFPPLLRSFRQDMPKKMRRLALRVVLSDKVREGGVVVVSNLDIPASRTREMAQVLDALGVTGSSLLVTAQAEPAVIRAGRNLHGVKTLPASLLNVGDVLSRRTMVITVDGVRRAEELWGRREGA
jgi:large subunit ribosomal protein L4